MKKVRESNYELMRIMAMFAIVLWHTIMHGKAIDVANNEAYIVLRFIFYLCIIHVNLFVMVSGYYQVSSKFNLKKIFNILIEVLFYNIVINCILKYTGLVNYTNIEFIKQIFFLNLSSYWFIAYYLLLYIISPFLNQYLLKLDQKRFKQLIICMLIIDSVLPLISGGLFYTNNSYGLIHFVTIYIIGAYINVFKKNTNALKKFNVTQKRLTYILIYLFCALFNLGLFYLSKYMISLNSNILVSIGHLINNEFVGYTYNQPIVIIQTIVVFLLFGTFSFKNKYINNIGSLMFGVYLVHESYYMRLNEYNWLHIADSNLSNGKGLLLRVLVGALIIFFSSAIIEGLRKLLFCLLNKIKFINDICNKFMNWIDRLIQIN